MKNFLINKRLNLVKKRVFQILIKFLLNFIIHVLINSQTFIYSDQQAQLIICKTSTILLVIGISVQLQTAIWPSSLSGPINKRPLQLKT